MPSPSPSFRLDFPPELPISARAEEIVATIQEHQVVVLAGETGSGKTTQIPKMCLAAGRGTKGQIACTQPRRVAATSISRRVAEELGVAWGREVGCKIRFDDRTSRETLIKFLTDGMLLAEVQSDPLLRNYDTIIIDEAHERSLNIDFLLGHLRQLRYRRPELKIVITSATIETEAFSKAFDGAPIIEVSGRTYPIETIYAPLDGFGSDAASDDEPESRAEALHYIDGAVEALERIVRESTSGDVLVFMPAERDIRETSELLDGRRLPNCEVVPLFGRLSNAEQQRVFAPSQRRKIVVATNIAETSLTIPGIRFVVDTGLARMSRYAPQSRTRRLPIEVISQASADQRKGRCGRVAEGVCIRLYSEKEFNERPRYTQPEIQRANLAEVILRMKAFGLGDIERFPFINMPAGKSIRAGYALLEELGAIENQRPEAGGQKSDVGGRTPEIRDQTADAREERGGSAAEAEAERLGGDASPYLRVLTPLGEELARLPVDPTVGRMILQARTEKAVREVLVIAAGLSVQDPRERPSDAREKADAAHRRFVHPDSDFLTLLNIWEAYHGEFETMGQAKLRRFCREHYLSYIRMREWRDIHGQLLDALEQRKDFKFTSVFDGATEGAGQPKREEASATAERGMRFGTASYRAIHRSILAGLLGNIAHRDDEDGSYRATHDRRVTIFPGSVLFAREEPRKRGADSGPRSPQKKDSKSPRWIMAAEMMETARVYARTCARLDPAWALELGAHVLKVAHSEPFWNEDGGRVMVKRRARLYGLELESRAVSYGKIDPIHATEIFIREALVNDTVTWPLDFLAHNRRTRERIEDLLTRTRDSGYMNLDEAVYRFYAAQLLPTEGRTNVPGGPAANAVRRDASPYQGVSSVAELVDLTRERVDAEPRFLMMEPEDLRDPEELQVDAETYPDVLPVDNRVLSLSYAYRPGEDTDGVTLEVPEREAERLTLAALDWAVPGHLQAKVEHYLRVLPKEWRRAFVPLAETARSLAEQLAQRDRLTGRREPLPEALVAQLRERFRVQIDPVWWADKPVPDHLRVRVRVLDDDGKEIAASRDLAELQTTLAQRKRELSANVAREDPDGWKRARAQWEKSDQTTWTFGDIPRRVNVSEQAGVPVIGWPGLRATAEGVQLRLFSNGEEALAATQRGLARMLELQLRYELAWLQKDLRGLRELGPLAVALAPVETLQEDAFQMIRRWICSSERVLGSHAPRQPGPAGPSGDTLVTAAGFASAVERAKADLRGLVPRLVDLLREILTLRQGLLTHAQPYAGAEEDVARLVYPPFLDKTSYGQLTHLPRYLKAMRVRADRWRQNPTKDAERARQIAPYMAALAKLPSAASGEMSEAVQRFRWLLEEFRVSLFAQELGTSEPVSTVKLDRALAEARGQPPSVSAEVRPASAAAPVRTASTLEKKAPLKNLGALDTFFRK